MMMDALKRLARRAGVVLAATLLVPLVACGSEEGTPPPTQGAGEPTVETTVPSDTGAATAPEPGTGEAAADSREVERMPQEEYPQEIDGYALVWTAGAPSYDIERDTVADSERISIMPHTKATPAREYYSVTSRESSELLPGIWCYIDTQDREACAFNGTTGRLWTSIDEFDTLTFDELAAWSAQFAQEIA